MENKAICETEENNDSINFIVQKNQPYITSIKYSNLRNVILSFNNILFLNY